MLAMNLYGWPPSSSVALVIAITCISALPSPTHQDGPASCLGVCAKARTRPYLPLKLKCLAIRGGEGSEYADLSVSTPSGESELCKWSYQSSSGPSSSGLALQKGSEGSSSTGLGIHNRNWSHVKAIGLPCFEYSEFNRVAKEAKLLRHAADGAYEAQGYRTEEKKRSLKELQRRREIAEDGKKKGWFQDGEGERIEGEPCSVCQKILCTCEFEKEQEEMRKRGVEDPFERIKDSGILQPGQDFLPSSSTPSADIEFWNKVEYHGGSSLEKADDENPLSDADDALVRVNPDTAALVNVARRQLGVIRGLRDVVTNKTEAEKKKRKKVAEKQEALESRREALANAIQHDEAAFPDSESLEGMEVEGRGGRGERRGMDRGMVSRSKELKKGKSEEEAEDEEDEDGGGWGGGGENEEGASATEGSDLIDEVSLIERELGWANGDEGQTATKKREWDKGGRGEQRYRGQGLEVKRKRGRDEGGGFVDSGGRGEGEWQRRSGARISSGDGGLGVLGRVKGVGVGKGGREERGTGSGELGRGRGSERKRGDVRKERERWGVGEEGGKGNAVAVDLDAVPLDLEYDSLEDVESKRRRELQIRHDREQEEEQRSLLPKFVRVYEDKDDKIGRRVSLEPQPDWVEGLLGTRDKRREPKRKTKFKDIAADLDGDE